MIRFVPVVTFRGLYNSAVFGNCINNAVFVKTGLIYEEVVGKRKSEHDNWMLLLPRRVPIFLDCR